jgi:hypothetical protein
MPYESYTGKGDPVNMTIRRWYKLSQSQAQFRGDSWSVSWEHFRNLWLSQGRYRRRGQAANSLCFSRRDFSLPWTDANTLVTSRIEYLRRPKNLRTSKKPRILQVLGE